MRAAGAVVVLVDGLLGAWLGRREASLLTFIDDDEHAATRRSALAAALAAEVRPGHRRALLIEQVDGAPAAASPLADALRAAGFAESVRGSLRRA